MNTLRPAAPTVLARAAGGRALLFECAAGQALPPHTHTDQTVTVAVLRGNALLSVDGVTHDLPAGEVLSVTSAGLFSFQATQEGTRVLVTLLNH